MFKSGLPTTLIMVGLFLFAISGLAVADTTDRHSITVYSSAQPGALDSRIIEQQIGNPDYRQQIPGYAIIRTTKTMDVPRGQGELQFTGVAASIDATTVSIEDVDDPQNMKVFEQSYHYDLVSTQRMLDRYLGEPIEVDVPAGVNGYERISGTLVASRDGDMILDVGGRLVSIGSQQTRNIRFGTLPEGLITVPRLAWQVASNRGGERDIRVSYEAQGMTWWADYNATLADEDGCKLDLSAWVSLVNQTGATFNDARLKLVAGDVNRTAAAKPVMRARRQEMMVMADAPAGFSEKEFFEYHLYTLGRQVDLPDRSIKQLELFEPVFAVDCERTLRVESGGWWGYPVEPNTGNGYPFSGERNVNAHVTFKNVEAVGLGIPLPKGRVRVSQEDTDGSLEFIGEDTIDHTPRKETVDLLLGQAFDVVAERKQADFRWSKGDRWMEEIVEVEIRNRKREPVRVEIREHLFRWSNWDINQSSEEFEKVDASTVDFSMMVPADDERTLTYTVRYTW